MKDDSGVDADDAVSVLLNVCSISFEEEQVSESCPSPSALVSSSSSSMVVVIRDTSQRMVLSSDESPGKSLSPVLSRVGERPRVESSGSRSNRDNAPTAQ